MSILVFKLNQFTFLFMISCIVILFNLILYLRCALKCVTISDQGRCRHLFFIVVANRVINCVLLVIY